MENKEYFTIINKDRFDDYRDMITLLGIVESDPIFDYSNWIVCYYNYHDDIIWYAGWDYLESADLVNKYIILNEKDFHLLADDKTTPDLFYVIDEDAKYIKENPKDYMFLFSDDVKVTINTTNNSKSSKTKPSYYKKGEYDLISHFYYIMPHEELRGFLKGNIIKYVERYRDKNGLEDLNKAREYNGRLIEFEKKLKGEDNEFIQ